MTTSQNPQKSSAVVAEFTYIDGTLAGPTFNGDARYTNFESPISGFSPGEPDAEPDPAMKLKLPTYIPGMKERPATVTISDSHPISLLMRREYSLPNIKCTVYRYLFDASAGPSGVTAEVQHLLTGNCLSARSPRGKKGILEVTVSNLKNEMQGNSGLVATPQCGWTFGDAKTCGYNLSAATETGSFTGYSANGFQVSVTGLSTPSFNYWKAGYLYHDGVSMRIRDWDGANTFLLSQRISYALKTASLPTAIEARPGCRLIPADCREFGRESAFMGIGQQIPAHHPMFEKGIG